MQIKDVIAQDDGILFFEDETRMTYEADINSLIKRKVNEFGALLDYEYFCNFEIDFDKKCLVWSNGEKLPFEIIENNSKEEFCFCRLHHIHRKMSKSELNELLEEFSDIAIDVIPGSNVYYYGEYLDGTANRFSSIDFIVLANRSFKYDFVQTHLNLFLHNLLEEGSRQFCTFKILEKDFKNNPEHLDDVKLLMTAKRIR